jgi:hypothetical protein
LVTYTDRINYAAVGISVLFLVLITWGLVMALITADVEALSGRPLRYAILLLLVTGSCVAASTVPISWATFRQDFRPAIVGFTIVAIYGIYQGIARLYDLPLAFLPVTNPSFETDIYKAGYQHGYSGAQLGWGDYFARASATFSEPAYFGRYLAIGLAVSIALLQLPGRNRRAGGIGLLLLLAAMVANRSLTGVASYCVVIAVATFPLLLRLKFKTLLQIVGAALAVAGVSLIFFRSLAEPLIHRLASLSVRDSSGRFEMLPLAVRSFVDHPLGQGLGTTPHAGELHNAIMLLALQFGIVGLLLPLAWTLAITYGLADLVRNISRSETVRAGTLISVSMLALQLASWAGGGILYDPLPWVLAGIAFRQLMSPQSERPGRTLVGDLTRHAAAAN